MRPRRFSLYLARIIVHSSHFADGNALRNKANVSDKSHALSWKHVYCFERKIWTFHLKIRTVFNQCMKYNISELCYQSYWSDFPIKMDCWQKRLAAGHVESKPAFCFYHSGCKAHGWGGWRDAETFYKWCTKFTLLLNFQISASSGNFV